MSKETKSTNEKQEKIVSMFDDIAGTYDVANRVMSMGVDIAWRKKACNLAFEYLGSDDVDMICDVACGTGDMMNYWKKQAKVNGIAIDKIVGVDPSVGMVGVAKDKFKDFDFHISKATEIPFEDSKADIISITYGIRNVLERVEAFNEFNRVLRKDGLVVILEFMKNENPSLLGRIRDFYMNRVLPKVGAFISKNKEAYEYLPNSIEGFLSKEAMIKELDGAGFDLVYEKSFSMDISTLIIARKR